MTLFDLFGYGYSESGSTVPLEAAIGLDAPTPGTLSLRVAPVDNPVAFTPSGEVLTAALPAVTVRDTRTAAQAQAGGWAVAGRAADFTAGNRVIDASLLAWAPSIVSSANGAQAGTVGATLKTPATLAEASQATREGTTVVSALLTLRPPSSVASGRYGSEILLTLFAKD
jgi:alkaline phosphatase